MANQKFGKDQWRRGPLHKLLFNRLHWMRSKQRPRLIDVDQLARKLNYSNQAIYNWLRSSRMTAKGARALVQVSRKSLSLRDLYPFVL